MAQKFTHSDVEHFYQQLSAELNKRTIRYKAHEFPSGAKMVDIWHKKLFYVIQMDDEIIGFSLIDADNVGFDTIPDHKFFTYHDFSIELTRILDYA